MKKKIFFAVSTMIFIILSIICICMLVTEEDVMINYDRESTVAIEGADGGIVVKEKKYDYDGSDVMILSVENQTPNAYTILIKSNFTKDDGTKKQMVQWFRGFPSGYQNYFIFQPEIRFADYTYEIRTQPYTGKVLADWIHFDSDISVIAKPVFDDMFGNPLDNYTTSLTFNQSYEHAIPDGLTVSCSTEIIVLDNSGEIYQIYQYNFHHNPQEPSNSDMRKLFRLNTLWEDYKIPLELKGNIKRIVALKSIDLVEE